MLKAKAIPFAAKLGRKGHVQCTMGKTLPGCPSLLGHRGRLSAREAAARLLVKPPAGFRLWPASHTALTRERFERRVGEERSESSPSKLQCTATISTGRRGTQSASKGKSGPRRKSLALVAVDLNSESAAKEG